MSGTLEPASYRYDDVLPASSRMLKEMLEASHIQQLFESYYSLLQIPVAVIDLNANVLSSSRWQRICTQFHRIHPATCERCIASDKKITAALERRQTSVVSPCPNGLTDCAAPILVEGVHVANVFVGQFLTETPDEEQFRKQAEEFGFNADDYIAAVRELPIVPKEQVPSILELLVRMTHVVTSLSIDRKRAIQDQARQFAILNTIPQAVGDIVKSCGTA